MKILTGVFLASAFLTSAVQAQSPTVIELYQSQGCSSCPPAIRNVNALSGRQDVLALTFAVTYWDRLGWKDTFAKPEFTQRQYDYAGGLHHEGVYTPQVVIDGRLDMAGIDTGELSQAIKRAAPLAGPSISESSGAVAVSAGDSADTADVWLVRYDPRITNVAIGAGENSGITIAHRNVVRELVHLGDWRGKQKSYPIAANTDANWRSAILVQAKRGGPILAAKVL